MSKREGRKFRIYPQTNGKHYYLVVCHSSLKSFLRVQREMGEDTVVASTITYRKKKRRRKVGQIDFHPDSLTPDLIAHEIDHLATAYLSIYLNIQSHPPESDEDELRASMVGRLHSQFYAEIKSD